MLERLLNFIFAVLLILGFAKLVEATEKPWPVIEGQPLVDQVCACQFMNINTAGLNYLEAIKSLNLRVNLRTGVNLALVGPPKFGRRYDCFANLSEEEEAEVKSTQLYSDVQFEILRQLDRLNAPSRGF